MDLNTFKNKNIEVVIDEIKTTYPVIRIVYPKSMLTADHRPERLNVYVDVHSRITGFDFG